MRRAGVKETVPLSYPKRTFLVDILRKDNQVLYINTHFTCFDIYIPKQYMKGTILWRAHLFPFGPSTRYLPYPPSLNNTICPASSISTRCLSYFYLNRWNLRNYSGEKSYQIAHVQRRTKPHKDSSHLCSVSWLKTSLLLMRQLIHLNNCQIFTCFIYKKCINLLLTCRVIVV